RHPRRNALAQGRLQQAQLVGQAHAQFEEAMIDRAHLAAERAPFGAAFAGGEGGHAADHADCGSRLGTGGKYAIAIARAARTAPIPAQIPTAPDRLTRPVSAPPMTPMTRPSGRAPDQLREVRIERA